MRPEILFPLFAPLASLKGVGPRSAGALEKVAGPAVRDLVFLAPQAIVRRVRTTVAAAEDGPDQTLLVTIEAHQHPRRPGTP